AFDDLLVTISQPIVAAPVAQSTNVLQLVNVDIITPATINVGDVITVTILQQGNLGTTTLNIDNTIDYTPDAGTIGTDLIDFELCNQCGQCDINTVTITINNSPPVFANPGSLVVEPGQTITIDLPLLASDPNNNLDISTLSIVSQPISGAVATIDINNILRIDYSDVAFNGIDQLTIEVCDLLGACTQLLISINVSGEITVHNAIAPTGRPLNQYMHIEGLPANTQVTIYNRWGDKVFEVDNYHNVSNRFSGLNDKGKELPSGTYFYKLEFADGRKALTGYLVIRR
ncbi:MAG: gliding motility-associated C-terminal domain-containing protein, partial [Flammeovirgaceae bacterium]|nr:gliding motility-associated C-terminal domain-containing protein [Flammeovirgaceae bacterium]